MKFGKKIKYARITLGLTQAELAQAVGVSLRTVVSYENGESYPKKREVYGKLAKALNIDANYLLIENKESTNITYDGKKYAQQLITEVSGLFVSGELDDEELDSIMRTITNVYWKAKDKRRGHAPRLCSITVK